MDGEDKSVCGFSNSADSCIPSSHPLTAVSQFKALFASNGAWLDKWRGRDGYNIWRKHNRWSEMWNMMIYGTSFHCVATDELL